MSLLLLLCIGGTAVADPQRLTIVVSDDDVKYRTIIRQYKTSLRNNRPDSAFTVHVIGATDGPQHLRDADFVLSLGSAAAKSALRHRGSAPLLCALISRASFQSLLQMKFDSVEAGLASGVSALYLDQPKQRIFQLAHLIVPQARSAGALLGPVLKTQQQDLANFAQDAGLTLQTAILQPDGNPVHELDKLIREVDVMVAIPDKAEMNRRSAKWLLYLSYRRLTPLVGFSKRYTEAGAVASIFSSSIDVAEEAAAISAGILQHAGPGSIHWPSRFSISTNHSVARTLGLKLRSEEFYQQNISEWEQPR